MHYTTDILILLIFFSTILLIIWVVQRQRPNMIFYQHQTVADMNILSAVHVLAMCSMLLPAWLISSVPFFLLKFAGEPNDVQLLSLLLCLVLIGFLPVRENDQEKISGTGPPSTSNVILYSALRIAFLIVYEWFFRGLLLFTSLQIVGRTNAVIINILLYTLAHLHKDRKEIMGCVPFGLLLCVFTLWWQSIWPAVIIHLVLAARYEGRPVYNFLHVQKKAAL